MKNGNAPHCRQSSKRKWNIEVHVHRKHGGGAWPIAPIASGYNSSMLYETTHPKYKSHAYSGKNRIQYSKDIFSESDTRSDTQPESRDILDTMIEYFEKICEVTRNNPGVFRRHKNLIPRQHYQGFTGETRPENPFLGYPTLNDSYQSLSDPLYDNFDGVIGFRATTCDTCLTLSLIGIGRNTEKKPEHTCNSLRLIEIQFLDALQKQLRMTQLKEKITTELFRTCKKWTRGTPYLAARQIPYDSGGFIQINTANSITAAWVLKVIKTRQIILSDDELFNFLKLSNNQTANTF